MIGNLDHIEVVLDDQNGISPVDKFVQNIQQVTDIFKMKAGSRFVENIKGLPRILLTQLCTQLHPLGFAAAEGYSRLSERDIT